MIFVVYILIGMMLLLVCACFIMAWTMHHKIFGKRFEVDALVTYYTKEEFGLSSQPVEFYCGKNLLRGEFYSYPQFKPDKIIIFAHGMWSSTKAYMQEIEYLCRSGYEVLGFDYVGTDTSFGKNIGGLSQSLKSLDCAITYLKGKETYKNKSFYVVGHSWGGYAVTNIVKYHSDIKGVVALAPFISIRQVLKGMFPKPLWILLPFIVLIEFFKFGGYACKNSIRSLKKYKGRTLIFHSEDDGMVSYKYNTWLLQKKCKNKNITYEIVEGKGHNPNYSKEAVFALTEYLQKLKTMSKEEAMEFKKKTNYHKLGELDENVMDKIVFFLEQA